MAAKRKTSASKATKSKKSAPKKRAATRRTSAAQSELIELRGQVAAIRKSQAVIEFSLDGTILDANDNFLNTLGYTLDEIVGQHHRIFAEPAYAQSAEYAAFWAKLGRGEFDSGEYMRIGKTGQEVWIQASYNPVFDAKGQPIKVIKFATDITEQKNRDANFAGQVQAIGKSQAVIEFDLDGTILDANENFLSTVGYSLTEIVGQHHRIFAEPTYAQSPEYAAFWAKLGRGEFDSGEYMRIAKGGKSVWIQASYNPIFDTSGRPVKVVKYATDITERKQAFADFQRVVESLAKGDLTDVMEGNLTEELSVLQTALNHSIGQLGMTINEIREAASRVADGSQEISTGNQDLNVRTQQQAAALEECASTIEQLTSTVKQNASNSKEADQLARGARELAENGGEVVRSAIEAMGGINSSSKKIADIIGVIDEIAFQTNLLALNAAVEAARAGEQGRGFAVVAAEVRNLAQRSAEAAKEIKSLINESVEQVEQGSRLVNDSGTKLEDIVQGVKKVSEIITEIAAAGDEQSTGIGQVNTAVREMDQMTQQNAALVEEASAASEAMNKQAYDLTSTVGYFKTGESHEIGSAPAIAPRNSASPQSRRRQPPVASGADDEEWTEF